MKLASAALLLAQCSISVPGLVFERVSDLPECHGSVTGTLQADCEDVPLDKCTQYYTPIKTGTSRVMQCGKSSGQCLARGPECVIPKVDDGFKEGSNYVVTKVSKRGYEYFGSTGDQGGPCVGADGKRPMMCFPKADNGFCKNDRCTGETEGCMDLCDSIPSCRGFSQHYGGCYVHIDPIDKDAKIADGTFEKCPWGSAASWPPICTNRGDKWCGNTEPTNNCLIKKWTASAPPILSGYTSGITYAATKTSTRGNHYFGSTGDQGGPCVGADGKRPMMCFPKADNGFCKNDRCTGETEGCMDLCDSIPSCRGFTQHYGGCYVHIDPKDKDAKIADGTFEKCPWGSAASWPPVCTNRGDKWCGNTEPTNNCLIKKEGR
ncbi:unnamed protein product [Symbiodinium necroappetens]|uniref:Uncharacterized protein n=1 Tax=Symbiodinium necroappetens TaxID=1628268 RepID=A0A812KNE8_9DINO|nr:unnamed protein product [Symbiodinium necroappetens]